MYTSYYMNGNLKIPNIQSNALSTIKYMVIDIDGTLTDGGIYYDEQGNEFKKFNTKDAAGFFTAKACGIFTVVITGRLILMNWRIWGMILMIIWGWN